RHEFVRLGQFTEESVDLFLKVAAFRDRTLELLRLLVPVGLLLDLAQIQAWKRVITDQGLDLPACDIVNDVSRRCVRAIGTADAIAPGLQQVRLSIEYEVIEVLFQAAIELRNE